LLDTMAARLALDQQLVTIEIDLDDPASGERLAWIYRHGTVHSQVSMGSRAVLQVHLPRRLVPMVGESRPRARAGGGRG
jgi:hypothetical protein